MTRSTISLILRHIGKLSSAIVLLLSVCPLASGNAEAAEQAPTEAKARTDHYGDPLPESARFRLGTIRLRLDGPVTALAWMPDGRTLVSSGPNSGIHLWQIPGGREFSKKHFAKWEKIEGAFWCLSPDGRSFTGRDAEAISRTICDQFRAFFRSSSTAERSARTSSSNC